MDLRATDRAITVNGGSYMLAQFSGTAIDAKFDISVNKPPLPTMTWRIDNGDWQEAEVAPDLKLADGLSGGSHTVWLMVRALDEHQSRWKAPLIASVTFLGFDFPTGGSLLPVLGEWDHPKLKIEFLGDSITEGVLVQDPRKDKTTWPWRTDALHSYSCQTALQLDAQWRQVGFGATGLAHGGSGNAPGALTSFNFFYDGCPRDDWQPDLVVINQGTNDRPMTEDAYEPLYAKYLAMVRQAYPAAKIVSLQPFVGAHAVSLKKAVDAANSAGDQQVYYIDTNGWYPASAPLHPNAQASIGIAAKLVEALKAIGIPSN